MNFDKIAQAANDTTMKEELKKQNINAVVKMIKKFPSEVNAIKDIINQLVIVPDIEIEPHYGRLPFYIVFKNIDKRPDWNENYYESEIYYYIFDEESVTRRCKYKTATLCYYNETKEISNTLEIPEMTIPYGDVPAVTRFYKSELPYIQKEYISDALEEYTKIDGKFRTLMNDDNVISREIKTYSSMGDTQGYIVEVNFYLEGNDVGERILIKNEVREKLENEDFEDKFKAEYKKHVLNGIKTADIEKSLEELLCKTFEEHTYFNDRDSMTLDITIFYDKLYVLTNAKPNINISFAPMNIECKSHYGKYYTTIGKITSDNMISIEMSDLFWKHHKSEKDLLFIDHYCSYSGGLNSVNYDDILSDDDEEFCDTACKAISEKVAATGLTVEKFECGWYENSKYPVFEIQIKNPVKG